MNMTKIDAVKNTIELTKGRFFVVTFIKADGTIRKMTTRIGVKKGIKGTGVPMKSDDTIRLYDVNIQQYRTVKPSNVICVQCGKLSYNDNCFNNHQMFLI